MKKKPQLKSPGPRGNLARLRRAPALVRYALAVGLVLIAFFTRVGLDPFLGEEAHPYATFYIAVTLAEFLLGLGPCLVVLTLGFCASLWFIVPPRDSLVIRGFSDAVEILLYFFVSGTIVGLMEWLHRARREAFENALLAKARQEEIEAAREHLEQLVDERTARLRKTVEELEHFSYALTHDMRAPLRAMRSYAELVREDSLGLSPQGQEFCHRIMAAAERLDLLICDSLNYAKVLSENLPLKPIALDAFLKDLIETYPNLQKHRRSIELAPDLPAVLANQAGLAQCFSNLLENAIKFAHPGRSIRVVIRAERKPGRTRILVEDNGSGIPLPAQPRLFGMFQRLNSDYEGTGIGLAIVRKVVERMGGTVGATSEPGQGSCFWVELGTAEQVKASLPDSPSQREPQKNAAPELILTPAAMTK